MTLTIELDPQTEARLAAEAKREGLPAPELALKYIRQQLPQQGVDDKTREENRAQLDVLAQRRVEGAAMTLEEAAEENRFWEDVIANLNQYRREQGMRQI